jgi:hypothetical protein
MQVTNINKNQHSPMQASQQTRPPHTQEHSEKAAEGRTERREPFPGQRSTNKFEERVPNQNSFDRRREFNPERRASQRPFMQRGSNSMTSRPSFYFNPGQGQNHSNGEMMGSSYSHINEILHPDNVIIVRGPKMPRFYVYLAKEMFHNQKFEVVELHGYGEEGIQVTAITTELITRLGYAEICKIKTDHGCYAGRKVSKLIVHLTRTPDFERLYKEFEEVRYHGPNEHPKRASPEEKAESEQKGRKGREDCQIEERVQEEDEADDESYHPPEEEVKLDEKEEEADEDCEVTLKNENDGSASDGSDGSEGEGEADKEEF